MISTTYMKASFATIALSCTLGSISLLGQLRPGDIAFTQVLNNGANSVISFVTFVDIPAGDVIFFTDQDWTANGFVADPNELGEGIFIWTSPPMDSQDNPDGIVAAGEQVQLDVSSDIELDVDETLYAYTGTAADPEFLYALVLDKDWNVWTSPPYGLTTDITYTAIGQIDGAPTNGDDVIIDHAIRKDIVDAALGSPRTQLQWLEIIANIDHWTYSGDTFNVPTEPTVDTFSINPNFPGVIEFANKDLFFYENDQSASVRLRRLYGSAGSINAFLTTETNVSDFSVLKANDFSLTNGFFDDLMGVAHTAVPFGDGDVWVIVTSGSNILLSTDAENWQLEDLSSQGITGLFDVAFTNNRFVAVGANGLIVVSNTISNWDALEDITWTPVNSNTSNDLFGVFHQTIVQQLLPDLEVVIATGDGGVSVSTDGGSNWTFYQVPGVKLYSATYNGSLFFVTGSGGTILYSEDGTEWTPDSTQSLTNVNLWDSAYIDGVLYAVGSNGNALKDNGSGWELVTSLSNRSFFSITQATVNANDIPVVVGANGIVIAKDANGELTRRRASARSASLYANATGGSKFVAVGEYGTILTGDLSGTRSLTAIVDAAAGDVRPLSNPSVTWDNGDIADQSVPITIEDDEIPENVERFDLKLISASGSILGNDVELGRSSIEVSIFDDDRGGSVVRQNYGAFVAFTNVTTASINNGDDPNQVTFSIRNTSPFASGDLFIRFVGSNLPDHALGPIAANTVSTPFTLSLPELVQAMELYEVPKTVDGNSNIDLEPIFKSRRFINSTYFELARTTNGELPGSLGDGFNVNTTSDFSAINTGGGQTGQGAGDGGGGFEPRPLSGGGGSPENPGDEPGGEDSGLLLLEVDVRLSGSPSSMETGQSVDFEAWGRWEDPEDPFNTLPFEELSPGDHTEADWSDDNSAYDLDMIDTDPDVDPDGDLVATNPTIQYPIDVEVMASSIEGAPLDGNDDPIPRTDTYTITINEPAANSDFTTWAAANITTPADRDMADNEDGDTLANFLEFAVGLDPDVSDIADFFGENEAFWSEYDDGTDTYTYYFRRPTNIKGVQYTIETSEGDLESFTDQTNLELDSEGGGYETWKYEVTAPTTPIYGRLQVDSF